MRSVYSVTKLVFVLVLMALVLQCFSYDCDDALHPSTELCKRWQTGGMCTEKRVRYFCQRSCNECIDEDNDDNSPQYLGCFQDSIESELELISSRHVSVPSCIETCGQKRFSYAGLRDGTYCMCGNDYGSRGEVLKRAGCMKRCGGRHACGGTLENAVYKTNHNQNNRRSYIDSIEELVLGKEKRNQMSRRPGPMKRKHSKIPKIRGWNFMDLLRNYEVENNNNMY